MRKPHLNNINHNYLRYANCWEDADVLLAGLAADSGSRILSIGSAGDNSFSLLTTDPEKVVAVDINPIQLRLIELKKAAFKTLEYEEWLEFLGFSVLDNPIQHWPKVAMALPEESFSFWSEREDWIKQGLIHGGKFERYFGLFRKNFLPLLHSKKTIESLQDVRSLQAQKAFYQEQWNTGRWRVFLRLFFSKLVMGKCGRDPAFLKEVKIPVNKFIMRKAEDHLQSNACQANYFLKYIMRGNFGSLLPHYARKTHFQKIKDNIDRLIVRQGLAEEGMQDPKGFTHMNLSNIFEYMAPTVFNNTVQALLKGSPEVQKIGYWNLMVPRNIPRVTPLFQPNLELSNHLSKQDKGFFYQRFNLDIRL